MNPYIGHDSQPAGVEEHRIVGGKGGGTRKIAGLDIGTTGCKCTVFDEKGSYLGKAYRDYPVRRNVSGHEIDVSAIMDGVVSAISEMAAVYPDIAGIGVTSFGETFVLTDVEGTPLMNAMLYTDPRGAEECGCLRALVGEKEIAAITGLRPHEMYSLPKLMWVKNHRPEIFAQAAYCMLMEDYVIFHLTGKRQIDYSLATRTMAFDITSLAWSKTMFEAAEISLSMMSEAVPTGTPAGPVKAEIAAKTGLPKNCLVVSISHDQVAAAVGAGAFDGDTAVDGAGTVECLTPVFDEKPDVDVMYNGYFSIVPYVIPGKYVAYAFSYTGGALIQWCTEKIAAGEKAAAEEKEMSLNEYLEQEYLAAGKPVPSGLLVLPHFAGAATPYMDTGSRGAILGLTTDTCAADIYRGCMEGVAYEMYLNACYLEGSGAHYKKMNATGGGARSKEWMQMKADILNIPITALRTSDAGTVGSAMLTGIAIGLFKDLPDAADHMVEVIGTYQPRQEMHEAYMKVFERYRNVYEAVRPLICVNGDRSN